MPIDFNDEIESEPTGPILDRPLHNEDEDVNDDGFEAI